MSDLDRKFMARALELAALGEGLVSPNPLVGAVVVQDGRIVGEGFHQFTLVRHAESYAIEMAGHLARGATLYCNLEPCCHHGRTPPCTDTLIEAGIGRVVVATEDPDPRVNHRGLDQLASAGIDIAVGLMAAEALRLNEIYLKHRATGRAFVHLVSRLQPGDASMSDEGNRTSALPGEWYPSTELLRLAHRYDLLVVGDASPASLAIAKGYIAPPRHRAPVIAGYAPSIDHVNDSLGPDSRAGVSFMALDDLPRHGQQLLAPNGRSRGNPGRAGLAALDGLIDALAGELVTSVLVLAGPLREGDLGAVDKITMIIASEGTATPEWLNLKGFGPCAGEANIVRAEGFVEVSRYPAG